MTALSKLGGILFLNEVLSITAQEYSRLCPYVDRMSVLNEVLSITAQECRDLFDVLAGLVSSMKS